MKQRYLFPESIDSTSLSRVWRLLHLNSSCFASKCVDDKAAQSLLNKLIRSNLVNTTNQVEVLQKDPTSPLYSVKSFEELRLWVCVCAEVMISQQWSPSFMCIYVYVTLLVGSLNSFKVFMPWASTGPPKSRRMPYHWCLQSRKWLKRHNWLKVGGLGQRSEINWSTYLNLLSKQNILRKMSALKAHTVLKVFRTKGVWQLCGWNTRRYADAS